MAGRKTPSPTQSKGRRRARLRLRGMSSQARTVPARPMGTLTKKISRQPPSAMSSPPTPGPGPGRGPAPRPGCRSPGPGCAGGRPGDDRDAVGLEHGRPDTLQCPEADEGGQAGSESAQGRSEHEEHETVGVEELCGRTCRRSAPPRAGARSGPAGRPGQPTARRRARRRNRVCRVGNARVTMLASNWPMKAPMHTAATV